jgi:hypothetical protein
LCHFHHILIRRIQLSIALNYLIVFLEHIGKAIAL